MPMPTVEMMGTSIVRLIHHTTNISASMIKMVFLGTTSAFLAAKKGKCSQPPHALLNLTELQSSQIRMPQCCPHDLQLLQRARTHGQRMSNQASDEL